MSQPERFETLVLGSGAGGKLLAWHMARSGGRTAVVERRWIGGSCPNINCLPSKNEIWSAKVAHLVHHAAQFGTVTGPVAIDMATVRQRKRDMVDRQIAAHLQNYKTSGAELIMGSGRFVAPKTLEVRLNDGGTRVLAGDQIFLNVGTHAAIPSVPGLEAARPLTNIEALELDYLPPHLIVLGGGYVGLEFAQAYRRFGSRVTVIQHGPQLMAREDPDVADEVQRILSDEGIQVLVAAETLQVHGRSGEEVSLVVRTSSGEQNIEGSDILVAAGRIPNTAGIGLEEAGVELDGRGYIRVNERLETSAPEVWAIGECAGSPQFTHVSEDDFRIIRDNLAGGKRSTRDRLVPFCMFTDPPLARVGLTEGEAQRQGVTVRVARLPISAVLRTQTSDERQGFMKALVGGSDDRILGFTMVGAEAGEVMAAVQTAMLADLPYTGLRDAILTHPTMAEGLGALFSNVPARPLQYRRTAERRCVAVLTDWSANMSSTIAGITIPDSKMARDLTQLIRDTESDLLFHHSTRVYLFGALTGQRKGLKYDPELLYVGAMFHDIGLTDTYRDSPLRFEVDGANAARDFLRSYGIPEASVETVWDAIALHTTPGIPEHKKAEVALVTAGVEMDVLGIAYEQFTPEQREAVVIAHPRGTSFKKNIIDAFYEGMKHRPDSTFGTVNDDVLAFKDPRFQRTDFCKVILASAWAS